MRAADALPVLRDLLPSLTLTASDDEERAVLGQLEALLAEALAAVRQTLVGANLAAAESRLDSALLNSLASMSVAQPVTQMVMATGDAAMPPSALPPLNAALSVGDPVYAKGTDRSIIKGVITQIDGNVLWVRDDANRQEVGYPDKSVKLRVTKAQATSAAAAAALAVPAAAPAAAPAVAPAAAPAMVPEAKIEFKFGKARAPPNKKAGPAAAAPAAALAASMPAEPAPVILAPELPIVPTRMPHLIAAIDTNELLRRESPFATHRPLLEWRRYLLQGFRSRACDVLVARQVLDELDGLKHSEDATLARTARRANACLAEAASAAEPWLLLEDDAAAAKTASLAPDERVIACAAAFALARRETHPKDRVVVATSDRNATIRARASQIEAMPLEKLSEVAAERDAAWTAAYCQDAASTALERAAASSSKGRGPYIMPYKS